MEDDELRPFADDDVVVVWIPTMLMSTENILYRQSVRSALSAVSPSVKPTAVPDSALMLQVHSVQRQ